MLIEKLRVNITRVGKDVVIMLRIGMDTVLQKLLQTFYSVLMNIVDLDQIAQLPCGWFSHSQV